MGKVISSKGNGFHTREKGFLGRGMSLEGDLLRKCVKPRGKGKNEGKKGLLTSNDGIMGKLVSM